MDLIISSWEFQGFSTAGFGEGLSDIRFGLFTDMVRLITWAQSISLTFGYVIENTPFQFDQKEKVQEHYTLVKYYLWGHSYSMWHNAVPMHTRCATSGPNLHHS
jgi:hypothetical protein